MADARYPSGIESVLRSFPKARPDLPAKYRALYESEYLQNRSGEALANRVARFLESWMHHRAARVPCPTGARILEIGAGTLNHLRYERNFLVYDVVEPARWLYAQSDDRERVGSFFAELEQVPVNTGYDKILSIAVLEHLADLPRALALALAGLRLKRGGYFCAGIPSEGALAWYLAWRYGTGLAFRCRTGLDYGLLMRHEHLNSAKEIEFCVRYFFQAVRVRRFPVALFHASLYTSIEAMEPRLERCAAFLSAPRSDSSR